MENPNYRVVVRADLGSPSASEQFLEEMLKENWELVSACVYQYTSTCKVERFYFRRRS